MEMDMDTNIPEGGFRIGCTYKTEAEAVACDPDELRSACIHVGPFEVPE